MTTSAPTAAPTITDSALTKIREVMSQQQLEADEKNLRIFVDGGGGCCGGGPSFGLAFDRKQDGDTQFSAAGMTIIVDPMSLPFCSGATIDFVDSADVQGFKVNSPAMQTLREQSSGGGCGGGSCGSGGGGGGCGSGGCGSGAEAEHGHSHAKPSGGACGSGGCGCG